MRSRHIAGLLVAVALVPLSQLAAQGRQGIELGTDIGAQYETGGETFLLSVPSTMLRVGFPLGDGRLRVEPRVQFQLVSGDGTGGAVDGQVALRYSLNGQPDRLQPYVLAYPEITAVFGDFGDKSQFGAGGGFGVLIPQGDQLAVRLEATYSRLFDPGVNLIRGSVGISFFTR
jgi:hypothetical protein